MDRQTLDAAYLRQLAALNPEQRLAVETTEGPVLVVAGPGTGKTQLLSMRVAAILRGVGTDEHSKGASVAAGSILCLTFTEAAAANMRERIIRFVGPQQGSAVQIHTFHSFARMVMAQYPETFPRERAVADAPAQHAVMHGVFEALPHDDPLAGRGQAVPYQYMSAALKRIEELKRGGLGPAAFAEIIERNAADCQKLGEAVHSAFGPRISKATPAAAQALLELADGEARPLPGGFYPLRTALARSLAAVLDTGEQTLLTDWKGRWTKRDGGRQVLAAQAYLPRMRSLARVYAGYQEAMAAAGMMDFSDMLLDVVSAAEADPVLKAELQERFLYVMADEFQDTNDAQLRLIHAIADAPVAEGRPNVLAVGDDDQGIYKFQGAESSNVLRFAERYRDPLIINLKRNYRSSPAVIAAASAAISQATDRLKLEGFSKKLIAENPAVRAGEVRRLEAGTPEQEALWIADDIASSSVPHIKIAVIARNHRALAGIASALRQRGIAVRYERQNDVLAMPHVRGLLDVAAAVSELSAMEVGRPDHQLAAIASSPWLGLDPLEVYRLSRTAYEERLPWMDAMAGSAYAPAREAAGWLLRLAAAARTESLDELMQEIAGPEVLEREGGGGFRSPYRSHYFGAARLTADPNGYAADLSALRALLASAAAFRPDRETRLHDLLELTDTHARYGLPLYDLSPFVSGPEAVNLMTAHKSKGLEFERVYVARADGPGWCASGREDGLQLPNNLRLGPPSETTDDYLRLFFVAVTRAESDLIITSSATAGGKPAAPLPFEIDVRLEAAASDPAEALAFSAAPPPAAAGTLKDALGGSLENYTLSASAFLDFLDVSKGGPLAFARKALLKFPEPQSAEAAYGTAVHAAMEALGRSVASGTPLHEDELAGRFTEALRAQRLGAAPYARYHGKGLAALRLFLSERLSELRADDLYEYSFSDAGSHAGHAKIGGKIDRISFNGGITVHDYKTGRARSGWAERGAELPLARYRLQLGFYHLLISSSERWCDQIPIAGRLEYLDPVHPELQGLEARFEPAELDRLGQLAERVHAHISALELPDTDGYSKDFAGMQRFMSDLLGE